MADYKPEFNTDPNTNALIEELMTAFGLPRDSVGLWREPLGWFVRVPDNITLEQVQTIVTAHNPAILTTEQAEATQADNAKNTLKTLMSGLHELSADDKSYAIACRIMAAKDGATQQTIMAIVDRPTAVAYITSKPEWTGATAATRNLVGDVLEMVAGITQILLLVIP